MYVLSLRLGHSHWSTWALYTSETASLIFSKASSRSWVQFHSAFLCVRRCSGSHSSDRCCRNLDTSQAQWISAGHSIFIIASTFLGSALTPFLVITCLINDTSPHSKWNFSLFSLIFVALQRSRRFVRFWLWSRSAFSSVSTIPMISSST